MVDGLFSLTMGKGWGREELMSVNSKTVAVLHVGGGRVPGQGWSRGWAGWRSLGTVNVNVLCNLSLLQTFEFNFSMAPCPSGEAGAELQHGDGGDGREGDYCGRQQEELKLQ